MSESSEDGLQHITTIIERVASSFSLVGSFVIIISFTCSTAFHRKPINRLIFYAAFGNVLSNVSTMIAAAYVDQPDSPGCQFQATMIQTFVPADAYWALAMAVNVWLTFYRKTDAVGLRKMEKWYFGLCYGCPLIPAIVMIFATNSNKGRIYGNAKLWCWITAEWPALRFATFYGPVWVAIITTFFIYSKAGRDIYAKRRELEDFGDRSGCQAELLTVLDPFSTKTTEIVVTSEPAPKDLSMNTPSWRRRLSFVGTAHTTDYPCSDEHHDETEHPAAYSVTISAKKMANKQSSTTPPAISLKDEIGPLRDHEHSRVASVCTPSLSSLHDSFPPDLEITTTTNTEQRNCAAATKLQHNRAAVAANSAAWSYTKCAMLFFTASIITWLPPTSNRLYNVISGGQSSPTLEYMSAFVLPMQGFWNCIIYCFTSRESVKLFLEEIVSSLAWSKGSCSHSSPSTASLTSPPLLSHRGGDFQDQEHSRTASTQSKRVEKCQSQYELTKQKQNHDQPDIVEGLHWDIQLTPPEQAHQIGFRSKLGVERRARRTLAKPFSVGSVAGSPKPETTAMVGSTRSSTAELVRPPKEDTAHP